jgi:Lrp/AsnC family transcriptional regulator
MDRLDRKILRLLQEDATLAVADVAKKVGLSTTPCWRRIQKLEEEGVIKRRVALLDAGKINVRVTVFVSIRTNSHSHEWLRRFSEVIQDFPEVIEFYRMSGDVDYLLRVVVPDIAAYDAFYKRLISKIEIRDVSSSFASIIVASGLYTLYRERVVGRGKAAAESTGPAMAPDGI